ncbi:DegV family protein [Anaerococcus degeneri]|uniref:DegV family protein n=1 Tax=Anaerococcus degeneri TaxID=361500 RepID=A0ABS7YXG4_9FIRM|nr:DegV family protein [Anaerococcus degeneri]MBP2015435.1 DegV family protein with EDD domain [Anaerococcus degeneri]MCA2095794.1 DegV family protein [Anaerococcus degeneri]
MEKIAILVDSGSDLSLDYIREEGFYYLPLYVNLDGKFLKDRLEISPEDFYSWIKTNNKLPKTSMPSPGDINELLEKIKEDGFEKVICINIGNKFSGTYNACKLAEVPGLEIYAFNTGNLTLAQGYYATYAKKLIDEGRSFAEITKKLEEKIYDSKVFFTIDTFKYIVEGGRVPKTFGKIGDALSVKPIIKTDPPEGGFAIEKIVRGEKKTLSQLEKIIRKNLEGVKDYYFFISEGDYPDGHQKMKERLKDIIENAKVYKEEQISPTLGANTGPGLIGIGFFILD